MGVKTHYILKKSKSCNKEYWDFQRKMVYNTLKIGNGDPNFNCSLGTTDR